VSDGHAAVASYVDDAAGSPQISAIQLLKYVAITLAMGVLVFPLVLLLTGCVEVKPEHIQLGGQVYIQGPATKAAPLLGLPDMGAHQLVALTPASEAQMTQHIPVWGCTALDAGTSLVGLAIGLAEANPIGIFVIPVMAVASHVAAKKAEHGDTSAAKAHSAVHCAAGIANLATIL
jgi:hypothetical protein